MKCRNCGAEITDGEIFCDDCKLKLKQVSSREELRELKQLIEEQNRFNDLDDTKVLDDLNDLSDKENIDSETEVLKDDSNIEEPKEEKESDNNIESNGKTNSTKKMDKKKLIIIISSVIAALILLIVIIVLIIKPGKKSEPEIDYKSIINSYGDEVKNVVENYMKEEKDAPSFNDIKDLIEYTDHKVSCSTHEIYKDGSIYLASCKVDGKDTKYTYGKKQDEVEGQVITIYKSKSNDNTYYNVNGGEEVGKVTCKTESCTHYFSYEKYSIIKEDGEFYIYDYETDTLQFGPFNLESELASDNTLYAVIYTEDGIQNMYSLTALKEFKNMNGTLENSDNKSIIYKYGYVIFNNKGKYNFVNLKTGNISYSIDCTSLGDLIEDTNNKLVYIKANTSDDKFKIYNSNGKLLFDGDEYSKFKLYSDRIVVANESNYKVYDLKLNLKSNSKILGTFDSLIAVINNDSLQIIDDADKTLVSFSDKWKSSYKYREELSGYTTYNDKNSLYIVAEDSDVELDTEGYGILYYYNKSTGENEVVKTTTLD